MAKVQYCTHRHCRLLSDLRSMLVVLISAVPSEKRTIIASRALKA